MSKLKRMVFKVGVACFPILFIGLSMGCTARLSQTVSRPALRIKVIESETKVPIAANVEVFSSSGVLEVQCDSLGVCIVDLDFGVVTYISVWKEFYYQRDLQILPKESDIVDTVVVLEKNEGPRGW